MEKISAKTFFTVLWSGVCQAIGWFFGLFGYKRGGKFAKCVWGVFATSAAVIMAVLAIAGVYALITEMGGSDDYDWSNSFNVSRDICYYDTGDGKGYVCNDLTGEKTLKHIAWIAVPLGDDSLVCYSDGKKRGYFNMYTGKVAIPAKYDHAWVFSDGLASVDEDGIIKFIDATGKVVIEPGLHYREWMSGYVYHSGYCVIDSEDGNNYGLMDKTGKMALPMEYKSIELYNDSLFCVVKGDEMGILDKNLKPILPLMACDIINCDETIDVIMPDNTMRIYALDGSLLNDFCINSVRMLEYETDAIVYPKSEPQTASVLDAESEWYEEVDEAYHPKATARLRAYSSGYGYEGLMTADGHMVTLPSYTSIEAIGPDLYLCEINNTSSVILNGRGQQVKGAVAP